MILLNNKTILGHRWNTYYKTFIDNLTDGNSKACKSMIEIVGMMEHSIALQITIIEATLMLPEYADTTGLVFELKALKTRRMSLKALGDNMVNELMKRR